MLSFTFGFLFRKAGHIQPRWPGGTQYQVHPLQRLIRSQQRIGQSGQRFGFFFIHRQNRDVLLEELLPPFRVIGNDVLRSQRQHHRYIMLFGILDGFHRRIRHRLARLAAHQIRSQHQRRGTGNHLFRNAFRTQLIHVARTDGKGSFARVANQGKTAANGPVHPLQIVQVSTAGGVAQIAIGVAADFDIAAHDPQQYRAVICQHRIIVHGIADRSAGKLVGN